MLSSTRVRIPAIFAVLAIVPQLAFAQGLSVSLTNGRSAVEKGLGNMRGLNVTLIRPRGERPWSLRYGATYLTGNTGTLGTICSGLSEPSICPPEVVDQKRRLITASAGFGHFAFRDRAVMLHSYADITVGTARKEDIGTRSGDSRSASKFTAGVRGGVEGQWAPAKALPFRLQFGMALEAVKPLGLTNCADCWLPFGGGFDLTRSYVGIVIGQPTFRPEK